MNKELLERAIEQLTWVIESDAGMAKWESEKPEDERDEEWIEHLSWLVEERTDIVDGLIEFQKQQ